jgi:AcrR family transcriptional regulator
MSPRPYRMERRREATDENRQRILNAARELLAGQEGSTRFSLEEVARRAGVARMTVYYQFGSLVGLLQGLCDSLAMAGGMSHLADVFREPMPSRPWTDSSRCSWISGSPTAWCSARWERSRY